MSCLIHASISINGEMTGDLFELYDRKDFDRMERLLMFKYMDM